MKVIDKRKNKDEDWNVGDVVYFKNYGQNVKDFGMIVQDPTSGRCSVVSLNTGCGHFSDQANVQYKEINRMIESYRDAWDCVEKVNAKLVIE